MKIKIEFFGIIINLFQFDDDPLQIAKEKYCFVFEYHLGMFLLLSARRELKNFLDFSIKIFNLFFN